MYSEPEKLPEKTKIQVAKKIEKTKLELKNLYSNPDKIITKEKVQRWGAMQVVKAFLGVPVVPGR